MFNKDKEQKKIKEGAVPKKEEQKFSISDIYVMPDRYRGAGSAGKVVSGGGVSAGGGKKPWTLIIAVVVVLVIVVSTAIVFFTLNLGQEQTQVALNNASSNVNTAAPVNTAANANANTNANANAPVNEAVSAPENVNANVPAEEESEIITVPAELPKSLDTDNDGLTNTEEALYNTEVSEPDTDGDGYNDGLEVENSYNPAGTAPIKIEESGLVKIYKNMNFNYEIFYPTPWLSRAIDDTDREALFIAPTGEFIQVIVQENPSLLTPVEWYLEESPGVQRSQITEFTTDYFSGIMSPNKSTAYFTSADRQNVYSITYNTGVRTSANFKTTFMMMINSFRPLSR